MTAAEECATAVEERAIAAEQELTVSESRLAEAMVTARECGEAEGHVVERATIAEQGFTTV